MVIKEDKTVQNAVTKLDKIYKNNTLKEIDQMKPNTKAILKKLVTKVKDEKLHKKFQKKKMDPDQSFNAVELIIPKEAVDNDKDLQKKIIPPKWDSYYYYMTSDMKVHKTWFENNQQAVAHYLLETKKDEKTAGAAISFLALGNGKIIKSKGGDNEMQLQKCIGQAVLDGNLKRKSFGKGFFYVVN